MSDSGGIDRLGFVLPDFTRYSWVGDQARRTWEPRMDRIRTAWPNIEWLSIVAKVRSCALVGLSPDVLSATAPQWSAHHLSAMGLPMSPPEAPAGIVLAVVGSLEDVTRAREAWVAREDDALGLLLGYPECCRKFFRAVWVDQRSIDTTWAMAANTAESSDSVVTLESQQPGLVNILWRWLGVRAVPHLPCRFDCGESLEFGERLLRVAEGAGYREEVEWIREILSWPVEWSALHGIAEIKTPILKISTRTDATAGKYVVRWTGTNYPREGATGLRFPYRVPARQLMTEGRSFQLGLNQIIQPLAPERSWYYLNNGFSSLEAMSDLHRPLVALARRKLSGLTGNVLDLGCGNGALLAKICEGQDGLTPYGVDSSDLSLEHARGLLPKFAENFQPGDIFNCDLWSGGPRYALTLLMAGRLLEVKRLVADRLLQTLRTKSDAILVYCYPGPGTRGLASLAQEWGLLLEDPTDEIAALLKNSEASRDSAIDWSRLAEPQASQYDTDVVLRLASATTSPNRPQPYRRTPVGESPSAFDGEVAIRTVCRSLPEFESFSAGYLDAPADHSNIGLAAEYIRSWPEAFRQCQRLVEAIHPAMDPRIPLESTEIYRGSTCHSFESLFGTLWATIYCPIGLAEAIVHEMAHQKLRVLGVSFESATAIVGNDPSEVYVSPIVKERRRPMTAVLHAQYSYVYVTTLDLYMFRAECDPARREVLGRVLGRNLARIEEGHETLRRCFIPGKHGQEFMEGFSAWTEKTMALAKSLLGRGNANVATVAAQSLPNIDISANTIHLPDREVKILLTLSAPRIVVLGNVLSDEECDALIEYCVPRMERSSVVADEEGNIQVHPNRTSRDVMLRRGETAMIARIEARLAALAQWPVERGEGMQVLRYDMGDEYRAHFDWMNPDLPGLSRHMEVGGQRLGTFVLYLSAVESGGGTSFPAVGLEVMPTKGGGLFFLNTNDRHAPDRLTLHAGSPVIKGVKFVANKWLRQRDC
jgi:prolyl 4-hydroxylase